MQRLHRATHKHTEFIKIRKSVREKAIRNGIVKHVSESTGMNKSTVSRIFAGRVCVRPNKDVVLALRSFLEIMGSEDPKDAAGGGLRVLPPADSARFGA